MWGTWSTITLAVTVGVALLLVGLAFGGWPVLIAFAIFAVVGAMLLAAAAWRRSGEYVERGDEGGVSTTARESHGGPRSGGTPASGEGG